MSRQFGQKRLNVARGALALLLLFLLAACQPASLMPLITQPTPRPVATATATATITASPTATITAIPTPTPTPSPPPIPTYDYEILAVYPHDPAAFTQGLVYHNGQLLEGTGRRGQSTLRRVDLATGRVRQQIPLAPDLFGEGITLFQEQIYQLTWQEHTGFVYDAASFALQRQFSYPTEGWGLTHDGRQLIMSDGSSTLYFLDPAGLTITGQVTVFDDQGPVNQLNELEYVQGEVWANVWHTDTIVRIDPATGRVVGRIDLTGLLRDVPANQPVDVLNGIAYDPAGDRLFVTGKLWPHLYEIRLHPRP